MDDESPRVILVGGTSHTGKSTLADGLAGRLGWEHLFTDTLKRHPGRPWKTPQREVPEHVAEHYLSLPVEELLADVLRHYLSLWPRIQDAVSARLADRSQPGLVIEGSAVWPESAASLPSRRVAAVWLTAGDGFLRERIRASSGFAAASPRERAMITKFVERAIAFNSRMMEAVRRLGLGSLNVEGLSPDDLCAACLELVGCR